MPVFNWNWHIFFVRERCWFQLKTDTYMTVSHRCCSELINRHFYADWANLIQSNQTNLFFRHPYFFCLPYLLLFFTHTSLSFRLSFSPPSLSPPAWRRRLLPLPGVAAAAAAAPPPWRGGGWCCFLPPPPPSVAMAAATALPSRRCCSPPSLTWSRRWFSPAWQQFDLWIFCGDFMIWDVDSVTTEGKELLPMICLWPIPASKGMNSKTSYGICNPILFHQKRTLVENGILILHSLALYLWSHVFTKMSSGAPFEQWETKEFWRTRFLWKNFVCAPLEQKNMSSKSFKVPMKWAISYVGISKEN